MRGGRRFAYKLVSALTAVWLLLAVSPVGAVTENDLRNVESKRNAARAKIREGETGKQQLNSEIKAADDQLGGLETELRQLDEQAGQAREAKNKITAELDRLRADLARSQAELDKANAKLRKLSLSLNRRAGSAYKNGNVSFLEVLLDARDFSDFVTRFQLLQTIISVDARLVKDIKTTRLKIEKARAKIDEERAQTQVREDALAAEANRLDGLVSNQLAKRNQVKASIDSKEQLIAKIDSDKEDWLAAEAEFAASEARIRDQLSRGRAAPVVGTPSTSGFIWPVYGTVSSPFGQRWGRPHEGIDISVPYGTPVVAAKAGTVAIADWYGGYGKLVVIDHGGGVMTRYGHNSEFKVSVGQQVSQGQVIANAGSTGHSTGPHVHFEVRIGGTAMNPLNYLP